ncbi:saccharopine dehydrogenase NADP-binding domain-containing protein [Paenibacillus sp. N4]|uniref:saccharopine dehydrogenase NADP-binding domain-containing protein n=1 Tax=Paenibacillus vietnamensis TaxID=2590547 RepID=UPI001CD06218|nr:saccharopine dehydrogenase NADP-binding domain-containing protein [Paenibacillus vietnamensis]MCA0755354.1 saccharopine dehydrogenase NADP-binding domain-containing protein [Paenibacillus vietnamensis]
MEKQPVVMTLLGSGGGVGRAVLALLEQVVRDANAPLHAEIASCTIHCIDSKKVDMNEFASSYGQLSSRIVLHQFDLKDTRRFKRHLVKTGTSLVIDASWADTVEMLACCDELGIMYVNTALESEEVDNRPELEGFTLIERYERFIKNRDGFKKLKAIVGSGMNPGVVQWMAISLMKEQPDKLPLACYIVERDDSFYADRSLQKPKTLYSTWSPECFLDEALLNYPMYVSRHQPLFLYEYVYAQTFTVRLGPVAFEGCLMPHEEVLSLGERYPFETGFIYRVNDVTTDILNSHLDDSDELWDWEHKLLDPRESELAGADLVGVLLVYDDHERFVYNIMENSSVYAAYGTNATYFQVACGLYGGICSLLQNEVPEGVHWVDELVDAGNVKYGEYLSYFLKPIIRGENATSEGLLLQRLREAGGS